jgi:hypothetical protein
MMEKENCIMWSSIICTTRRVLLMPSSQKESVGQDGYWRDVKYLQSFYKKGERPLGKLRHRWKGDTVINLIGI